MQPNPESFLDRPVSRVWKIDWERSLWIALLIAAILTRFWDLGYRSYNHDESIHTHWSWNLYTGRGYQHNPIYHGPLLYITTALTFALFGDNDVTGRIPNVVFGIVLVMLPYLFRDWLGRKGALVTGAMLLLSPAVLYYSRFNRHDIYVDVFTVLLALVIWKYYTDRRVIWLYATAGLLSLSFTAMETTFIFVAVFAIFLCGHFTFEYLRPRVKWKDTTLGLFAAAGGIPYFGIFVVTKFIGTLLGRVRDAEWKEIPSFNLAMVAGTFSLPLITPALIYLLNPIWQSLLGSDFYPITGFTEAATITTIAQTQPEVMLRVFILTFITIFLSTAIGWWWDGRHWLICAILFWPAFAFFFTTAFTNGQGFFTGLLGSLGYWLSQQGVQRGGQPAWYYFLVQLPLYEFLPYTIALVTMFWYWLRYRANALTILLFWFLAIILYTIAYLGIPPNITGFRALVGNPSLLDHVISALFGSLVLVTFYVSFDRNESTSWFPAFIFTWAVGNLVIFSWAGEKMPWLTTHLVLPLAFVAGWGMERLLGADWREMLSRGGAWIGLLVFAGLILLVPLVTTQPFQGVALQQLNATIGFLLALVMLGFTVFALYRLAHRFTRQEIARIVTVSTIILMTGLTVRAAWMAVYENPDVATESIIYAQGSPDVPIAMREIEELSRRLCAQITPGRQTIQCENGTIKVAYDDDSSWPFVWYLRNYRNAQFYGANPNAPFDAPVVIVGPKNEETVKPFLGNKYARRAYKLIWWPLEGYKDLTLERIWDYVSNPQRRADLFNAWFYRRYKENLSQWPYVHTFAFYVRKDVATLVWNYAAEIPPQPQPDDDYLKKQVRLEATRALGTQGQNNGQFEFPKNVALDASGNLYVADSDNGRIQKFDSSGRFLQAWGTKSPENQVGAPGTFSQIWGLAIDKQGNVYVADTWNHRIQKFDSHGRFLQMWGENGDTRGVAHIEPNKFYGPRSITIDDQGNLYVTDTGNKRVLKFSPNGVPLAQYGGLGTDPGKFQEPVGVAIDPQGNFFIADTWNQRIQKFDRNFEFVAQWPVIAWESQSVVNKPYLAVNSEGNLFVSDPDGARILKFTNDGTLLAVFGTRGSDLSSFFLPTGLAFDGQGSLYVADSGNHRILIFARP